MILMVKNLMRPDIIDSCNPVLANWPLKEDIDMQRRFDKITALYAGVILGISPRKPLITGVSPT